MPSSFHAETVSLYNQRDIPLRNGIQFLQYLAQLRENVSHTFTHTVKRIGVNEFPILRLGETLLPGNKGQSGLSCFKAIVCPSLHIFTTFLLQMVPEPLSRHSDRATDWMTKKSCRKAHPDSYSTGTRGSSLGIKP
jgi:hypothetical protein